jgi:hypothetical protein
VDRIWTLPALSSVEAAARLSADLGVPRAAGEILLRRGLDDPAAARRFLDAGADDLHDPFLLPDLEPAAHRVAAAVRSGERIVVHGDYDADGITGSALLAGALGRLGATAEAFVPDRVKDGYGVSSRLVEHAGARGVTLLITVDTGSSAHEPLQRARELGIDVVVCDHHLFERRPAGATFLLNPHRPDSAYPNLDLCGCGVAWKLLRGIAAVMGRQLPIGEELELVAIALPHQRRRPDRQRAAGARPAADRRPGPGVAPGQPARRAQPAAAGAGPPHDRGGGPPGTRAVGRRAARGAGAGIIRELARGDRRDRCRSPRGAVPRSVHPAVGGRGRGAGFGAQRSGLRSEAGAGRLRGPADPLRGAHGGRGAHPARGTHSRAGRPEIDEPLAHFLQRLGPHGPGHPEPVFAAYDVQLHGAPSVVRQKHLKLTLGDSGVRRSFIGFGYAPRFASGLRGGSRMDVAFRARFVPHPRFDPWQLSLEGLRVHPQPSQP